MLEASYLLNSRKCIFIAALPPSNKFLVFFSSYQPASYPIPQFLPNSNPVFPIPLILLPFLFFLVSVSIAPFIRGDHLVISHSAEPASDCIPLRSMYKAFSYLSRLARTPGVMEVFYEEVWGNTSTIQITEFKVDVPQPQFYIDPQYRDMAEGPQVSQFQLTGISKKVRSKRFLKVQPTKELAPVSTSFILRQEYVRIEMLLERAAAEKWANEKGGRLRHAGVSLDYRVSGQPGSGLYLPPFCSPQEG